MVLVPTVTEILSFIIFAVTVLLGGSPIIILVTAIILFAAFDVLGFRFMLKPFHPMVPTEASTEVYQTALISYRVIQTIFQHSLTFIIWAFVGWEYATFYVFLWWFGVCDILYYLLLSENFTKFGHMSWLWWTPYGYPSLLSKRYMITPTGVIIQALLGISVVGFVIGAYL